MTIDEIREKLSDRNLRVVAERSGAGYRTLVNIANGTNKNPTMRVYNKIVSYLESDND